VRLPSAPSDEFLDFDEVGTFQLTTSTSAGRRPSDLCGPRFPLPDPPHRHRPVVVPKAGSGLSDVVISSRRHSEKARASRADEESVTRE